MTSPGYDAIAAKWDSPFGLSHDLPPFDDLCGDGDENKNLLEDCNSIALNCIQTNKTPERTLSNDN